MTTTTRPSTHPVFAAFSDTAKAGIDRSAGFIDPTVIADQIATLDDLLALLGRYEHAATGNTRNADRATRILVFLTNTLKDGAQ